MRMENTHTESRKKMFYFTALDVSLRYFDEKNCTKNLTQKKIANVMFWKIYCNVPYYALVKQRIWLPYLLFSRLGSSHLLDERNYFDLSAIFSLFVHLISTPSHLMMVYICISKCQLLCCFIILFAFSFLDTRPACVLFFLILWWVLIHLSK